MGEIAWWVLNHKNPHFWLGQDPVGEHFLSRYYVKELRLSIPDFWGLTLGKMEIFIYFPQLLWVKYFKESRGQSQFSHIFSRKLRNIQIYSISLDFQPKITEN